MNPLKQKNLIKLTSQNYPGKALEFIIVPGKREAVIALPDGRPLAVLTVSAMETDIPDPESPNKYKTVATNNFFLCFTPVASSTDKDIADVLLEP